MNTIRSTDFYSAFTDAGHGPGTQAGFSAHPMDEDTLARLVLTELCEVNHSEVGRLVMTRGAADALRLLLEAGKDELTENGLQLDASRTARLRAANLPDIVRRISDALRLSAAGTLELMTPEHDHWPLSMGDLHSRAPLALWGRGNTELLTRWRNITLTGARAATGLGEHVSMEFASDLAHRDQAIVNGGSYGIEGMALRAALASGGTPIAVMSGGLDRLYPGGHEALLTRVVEKGVLVSEQLPDAPPNRWRFSAAARLKAALSHSTVVIEAGARSGALATAAQAKLLGRFVGAVPGPVTSAASHGCHALIQQGTAQLVAAVTDIPAVVNDPSIGPMVRRPARTTTAQAMHTDADSLQTAAHPAR